ncbi:MarR family winged helix-turn-helix transcriptional regulator [Urechidicola croceus]|uniref:MarR family transcriptional regulator n=1 Tax=Urechidicola croceus TaxID=1850246 RepID=A0A1D8P6M3_9FLAO|nr:MarR family transcriptional regulator [Urechidicola croceus]AOW20225.1 MarR family transcriptional regulator [Urechidicola croceus]
MGDLSKDINSKFSSEKMKVFINIKYTANWLSSLESDFFKPFNISSQQYNVLRILKGAGKKITVNAVKDRMIERSPNTTRMMDKLCEKNFIERERCENDRRVVYVNITDKGLKLVNQIPIEVLENEIEKITEKEAETLNFLLDKIR